METPRAAAVEIERLGPPLLTYARVLAISLPIILSNITTPFLGVTHTAVVGQLGEARLIGAVALGAVIFALLFWAFGFLRMGTTGLCAQADGAGDQRLVSAILARALLIAGGASLLPLILQIPLEEISFYLLEAPQSVESEARSYFGIRIWSAPFALANYTILGWFIGLGKTRTALLLGVALNGANVILSIALVSWLGWGVPGVAAATIIAEGFAAMLGIFIGATRTRDMRNMMIVSLAVFLAAWAMLTPAFGNHGLWASMIVFFLIRAATLAASYPALERASFGIKALGSPSVQHPSL